MSGAPWKASFPVLVDPWSKTECLCYYMKPIKHAIYPRDIMPSHCHVVGFNRAGQHFKFTVTMKQWGDAHRNPVVMMQAGDAQAPSAAIVDAAGRVLLFAPD